MMFRMGGAEAFARQHVSMADNKQNDTRPIQPSQPPMASQIHPESHRPIADSPDQLAHSPKPPATPPSQWQERSAAQYDFRSVGQFPFAHAHSRQDRLSPRWHGGGRPCDQCGEATEQFQVIVLVKQIAKITDGLVHVLVSAASARVMAENNSSRNSRSNGTGRTDHRNARPSRTGHHQRSGMPFGRGTNPYSH